MSGQFKKYGGRYNYHKNEIIQSDSVTTNYLQTKNFASEYFDGTNRKYMLTINEDIISVNNNRIQNVGDPFEPGDVINLEYFHRYNSDISGSYVKREGDTMIGLLNVSPETKYVTGLKNSLVVDNTNIYNKAYVDTNGVVKYLTDQTINTIQADSNIKVINNDGSTHLGHLWITDQISAGYIQSYDNGYFSAGKPQDAPSSLLLNPKGGNIGIGLAEPKEALDVNGSAIFSGSAEIGQVKIWDMSSSGSYSNITTANATMNIGMESSAANYSSSLISLNANNVDVSNIFTANNRIRLQANGYWSQLYFGSDKNNSGKESRLYISPNNSMGGPFSSNTVYIEAGLNMSGNKITGLANPSSDTDVVNLQYLQANYSPSSANTEFVKKSGDTMTGNLTVNGSGGIKSVWVGEYIVNNSSYNIITSSNGAGLYGQKGSSNNQDGLLFRVNNTGTPYTGMVLTSDGNVGINTITPSEKLDVYGTAQFNNATTGGNNFVNINSNGIMTIDTSASKEQQLILSSSTGEHTHQLLFQVDYGTAVGATSPTFNDAILSSNANLFIGSYGNKQPFTGLTGNYAYTQYNNTTSSNSIIHNGDVTCNNSLSVKGILDMGGYKITSLANPSSTTEAVTLGYLEANYIPSSGATNFVKKNGDTMTGPLYLTTDGTAYLRFVTQAGKTFIENGRTTGKSTSDLYFSSMDGGQNNMVIKENGNVGIGTTSPTEKLDVNGTAQFNNATTGGNNYVNIDSNGMMTINTKGSQDTQLSLDSGFHQMLFQVDYGTDIGANKGSDHDRIISQNTTFIVGTNADGNYPNTTYVASENTITQTANVVTCSNDLTVNGQTNTNKIVISDKWEILNNSNQFSFGENNGSILFALLDTPEAQFDCKVQSYGFITISDQRTKHNIEDINDALSIINKINIKKYVKTREFYDVGHDFQIDQEGNYVDDNGEIIPKEFQEIGVIAQDMRDNIPELAHVVNGQETKIDACGNTINTSLSVSYHDIFSLNVQATQELADKYEQLEISYNILLAELNNKISKNFLNATRSEPFFSIIENISIFSIFNIYNNNDLINNNKYIVKNTGLYSFTISLHLNIDLLPDTVLHSNLIIKFVKNGTSNNIFNGKIDNLFNNTYIYELHENDVIDLILISTQSIPITVNSFVNIYKI